MAALVDLNMISIPVGRFRKAFPADKHHELMNSILAIGLLNPPVITKDGVLVAGERRLRAIQRIAELNLTHQCHGKTIAPGMIYASYFGDDTLSKVLQAEYDENEIRLEISWQDKAEATRRLHDIRVQKIIEKDPLLDFEVESNLQHVVAETAAQVVDLPISALNPGHIENVKKDLVVSAWLAKGPDEEVEKAPTRKDALKIIERKLVEGHRKALSKAFKADQQKTGHKLILGSMLTELPQIPDNYFEAIICDPPYGINAHKWNNQCDNKHLYEDTPELFIEMTEVLAREGFRITKAKAHAYIFCAFENFRHVCNVFERNGWSAWKYPLFWFRNDGMGIVPRAEHGPRRSYEVIAFLNKGDKRVNYIAPDVLAFPGDRSLDSGAHKPVALYMELLARSCQPGDFVIDPTCGSGPIFPAAQARELIATGIELDPERHGICTQRISQL